MGLRVSAGLVGAVWSVGVVGVVGNARAQVVPAGFSDQLVVGGWNQAVGVTFGSDGRGYVWEKGGRVWLVENGQPSAQPLVDISEEVGDWRDLGLLGFAIDPNFASNGYVYLLYAVDFHHARYFGTPQYDPGTNEYFRDSIGRLTRYTARTADGRRTVDPASRLVLVGETLSTGFPLCHQSHGVGTVAFGEDGTLLAGCGDGASYEEVDAGGPKNGSSNTALADGIIQQKEDVGAYRAQLVDSLNGKIIRINPTTGDGVPSNPHFDPANPRSAKSRMWARGFRNPFRWAVRPGSGSANPSAGDPGSIYVGDVGWFQREEIAVITAGGQNSGWPVIEGLAGSIYPAPGSANRDCPNPRFGIASCTISNFRFHDLLVQETLAAPSWPNPCNGSFQIPAYPDRAMHTRPVLEYGHGGPTHVPSFSGNAAIEIDVTSPQSPIPGVELGGSSVTGGVWLAPNTYPAPWAGTYFFADFTEGWVASAAFDAKDRLLEFRRFGEQMGAVVCMAQNPADGDLYYVNYDQQGASSLRRVSFVGNQPPVAVIASDRTFGPGPLTVNFRGDASSDPEGGPIEYLWDFGDGTTSTAANPSHTFASLGGPGRYDVSLTVTDDNSRTGRADLVISTDNTPPRVTITSVVDGAAFCVESGSLNMPLRASVSDAEHGSGELTCRWQTIVHHNTHAHPEPPEFECESSAAVSGHGDTGEVFSFEFVLRVTDAAGLTTERRATIFPVCCHGGPGAAVCNTNGTPDDCEILPRMTADFAAGQTDGFSSNGSASFIDDEARLTPANFVQMGSIISDVLPATGAGGTVGDFGVAFDFRIGGGSGADGFAWALMNPGAFGPGTIFGEEGPGGDALTINFDTYRNEYDPNDNHIAMFYRGQFVGLYNPPFSLRDGQKHRCTVVRRGDRVTVRVTAAGFGELTAFDQVVLPGFTPTSARLGFGGRTGGLTDEHRIDNVVFGVPGDFDGNSNGTADLCEAPCAADFNGDGFLDFFDFDDFVTCFEGGPCPPGRTADFDGDGFADFFDYDAFVAAFEAGC